MRLRAFRFLKTRMRNMIMPAAVGIGLAAGGCTKDAPVFVKYGVPMPPDAALVNRDVSFRDVSVSGPEVSAADAREVATALDVPLTAPDVAAPTNRAVADQGPATDSDSGLADAPADVFAPRDGNGTSEAGGEAGGEAGPIISKYVAPMPDAANDLGLAVRYMAQMPDSGA